MIVFTNNINFNNPIFLVIAIIMIIFAVCGLTYCIKLLIEEKKGENE